MNPEERAVVMVAAVKQKTPLKLGAGAPALQARVPRLHRRAGNVGAGERLASVAAGAALVAHALTRRSPWSLLTAGLGAGLLVHGAKPYCAAYRALGLTYGDATTLSNPFTRGVSTRQSITIGRPPREVYVLWRDLERWPALIAGLQAAHWLDDRRSRWRFAMPTGHVVEWDADVTHDEPGRRLAWRSVGDTAFRHEGIVTFTDAPGDRGTQVTLDLHYRPTGGALGQAAAMLLGRDPRAQAGAALRRFKQLLETGEVASAAGPSCRRSAHPAADRASSNLDETPRGVR